MDNRVLTEHPPEILGGLSATSYSHFLAQQLYQATEREIPPDVYLGPYAYNTPTPGDPNNNSSSNTSNTNNNALNTSTELDIKDLVYGAGAAEYGVTETPPPPDNANSHKNYTIESLMNTYQASVSTSLEGYEGLGSWPPARPQDTEGYSNMMEQVQSQAISRKVRWRDWNEEFQSLLDMKPCMEKYERLANLEKDFVYTAKLYGHIIITESGLPVTERTIKPVNVGGIAGGTKYCVNGILFKFAVAGDERLYPNDECAMKTCGHERNGLIAIYHSEVTELRVPLMAYIDYRGFRLMAISLLPINNTTLKYGSNDGTAHVHTSDPYLNELMANAGHKLNLKPHIVGADKDGNSGSLIYGPGDIEGHFGTDGRYYVLDFARLAPPEPTAVSSERGAFLYRLLRMELVCNNETPLSCDAYSYIGRIGSEENNEEVRRAYQKLLDMVIPAFAKSLDDEGGIPDYDQLISKLHNSGINVRLIGHVRNLCTHETVREKLLVEAATRIFKTNLRKLMRDQRNKSGASEQPYRNLAIDFLNLVAGSTRPNFSQSYWGEVLVQEIANKFPKLLNESDYGTLYRVCMEKHGIELMKRLTDVCGIKLQKQAMKSFSERIKGGSCQFQFVDPDLKEMVTVVCHLNIICYSSGMALYYRAKSMHMHDCTSQIRLLRLARARLQAARYSMCATEDAILNLAVVDLFLAKIQTENQEEPRVSDASSLRQYAHHSALSSDSRFLSLSGRVFSLSIIRKKKSLIDAEASLQNLLEMDLSETKKHDVLISLAKCLRSRAKIERNPDLQELVQKTVNEALSIKKSEPGVYILGKSLYKHATSNKSDPTLLQQAEIHLEEAHALDNISGPTSFLLAKILHTRQLKWEQERFTINDDLTISLTISNDEEAAKETLFKRVGKLYDIAIRQYL